MAKLTDIEQRLQALEARQNMQPGGSVNNSIPGLGNITIPNTYIDPNTNKTINISIPSVPNMGQSNVTTPPTITPTTTPPTITPTITPTTTPEKFYVFDSGTVRSSGTDLTGQSAVAGGPFNTREEAEAFKASQATTEPLKTEEKFYVFDSGTIRSSSTDLTGQSAIAGGPFNTREEAEAFKASQATTETEIKKPIVERPDLVSPFSDLIRTKGASLTDQDILNAFPNYTDKEIYQYLSTSGLNREGSIAYSAINRYLNSHKVNPETGELEYTGSATRSTTEEEKDTSPMFTVIRREPVGDNQVRVIYQDTNPDSPTFGRFETEIEGATEEERRFDFYVTDSGAVRPSEKGQSPAFIQAVYAGPFTTQQEANTAAEAYKASDAFRERNESLPDIGGGTGGTGGAGGQGTGLEGAYSDVINQMDQFAGLTSKAPALGSGQMYNPQNMGVLSGELETTAGIQLGTDPVATTTTAGADDLQATVPTGPTVSTIDSIGKTQTDINNLALSAAQTNALTSQVQAQIGTLDANATITPETLAGIKPAADSIEVKKAEMTKEPTNMTGATLTEAVPQANQVTTDYNVAMQAAQGTVSNDQLATAQTLPGSVAQAEAQVMSELNQQATMQAAQTSADEFTRTQAQAIEQQMSEVPKEATIQGQLESLMAQFGDGNVPTYAAGAIRNANAVMAQRGLSASSMAGMAIMQAAMEASLPIAAQDAQIFREINLTNINNKQKVALANAAAATNISLANLSARQQAALSNSTNAFKLQSQSLTNTQQTAIANAQLQYAIQDKELTFAQQTNIANAARHAELNNINLSNDQQARLTNTSANLQVDLTNLSNKQQTALANTQVEAAIRGQELTNAQQAQVINAARLAEQNNLMFNEEQTRNLNNAKIMENMTLTNLDADMKAALTNAATYASMDMANLNNRQQAEVLNAQAFLQLDMANLTNKQQGEVLQYQAKTQSLFTDAAADNARKQFNAQSENQLESFFADLGARVRNENLNRVSAMRQFNVNEENAQARYNTSVIDSRDKFDSTMQAQINQSNAAWRRQINTSNTANQNEANRQNALNLLNVSQNALNRIWQAYRDESGWLTQKSMNREQFAHELAKLGLSGDVNARLFNQQVKANTWSAIGTGLYNWIKGL